MDLTDIANEAAAVRELTLEAERGVVRFSASGNREFVALPLADGGYRLDQITLTNAADVIAPKIVTQAVNLQIAASMVEYVNRFKNVDSVLFANIQSNEIVALIDYHKMPGANMIGSEDKTDHDAHAAHAAHRATLKLPFSLEWGIWNGSSGKLIRHIEFASFLEENGVDVIDPSGAALLELCRDLHVNSNMSFNSTIRHGDAVKIEFQKGEDVSTKDALELPAEIMIQIPVYFGEPAVQIKAYLRRKVDDGKLFLGYTLNRAEAARQAEFHRIVNEMQANVDHLTTVYGTPS